MYHTQHLVTSGSKFIIIIIIIIILFGRVWNLVTGRKRVCHI